MAPEADKKENNKAAAEDWVGHPTVTPLGYQKLAFTQSCSPFCFTCQLISMAALGNRAARLCQMSPTREHEEPR